MHGPFAQLGCQRQLEECGGVGTLSRNGDPRTTQDVMAAGRRWAGTEVARWRARRRRSCTDSLPNLPPVSMPTMTNRQRRVRSSSGYVWNRLRVVAWSGARGAVADVGSTRAQVSPARRLVPDVCVAPMGPEAVCRCGSEAKLPEALSQLGCGEAVGGQGSAVLL